MKCPHLKTAPLIPFRDKKYLYCEIKNGPYDKTMLDQDLIGTFCDVEEPQYYENCSFWQKHYSERWDKFQATFKDNLSRLNEKVEFNGDEKTDG